MAMSLGQAEELLRQALHLGPVPEADLAGFVLVFLCFRSYSSFFHLFSLVFTLLLTET